LFGRHVLAGLEAVENFAIGHDKAIPLAQRGGLAIAQRSHGLFLGLARGAEKMLAQRARDMESQIPLPIAIPER